MSFNIVKDNTPKTFTTSTVEENETEDVFNINKNPEDYVKNEELQGLEFLVDENDEENEDENDDENEDEKEEDEEEEEEFTREPLNANSLHVEEPKRTFEDIQQEKAFYLSQLTRLTNKGHLSSRRFGMEHSLEQIRGEVFRIKKEINVDAGIDYCRQGLMFCVSTIEMVEGTYSTGSMAGWSQTVMGNIESYDEVFEELYEKYFSESKMGPEFKLLSLLAGSAFMFRLNKTMATGEPLAPRQREMTGPSMDTDELLSRLNQEVDMDDISSVGTSAASEASLVIKEPEVKSIPVKKGRGRPKKQK